MIKTVIFDIGNVIAGFDHSKACKRLAKKSCHSPGEIYDHIFNTSLIEDYDRGMISSREFYGRSEKYIKSGMTYDIFINIWGDIFTPDRAVEEIIKDLWKKVDLYLLSDTNEQHYRFLEKNYEVFKYFKDKVLSFEEGCKKPDRRIFKSVLKKTAVAPQDILYIDDREENVEAFRKLGVHGIVFHSGIKLKKELLRYKI